MRCFVVRDACVGCDKPTDCWTAVLLLTLVIGAAGCGDAANDAQGTTLQRTAQESSERPAAEKQPATTAGQKEALAKAQPSVFYSGISKKELIKGLQRDGFSKADATFAANTIEVNWNQEALEAAHEAAHRCGVRRRCRRGSTVYYLDEGPRAKDALMRHLTRVDGFTPAQAHHALNKFYDPAGSMSETTAQESGDEPAAEKQPARTAGQKQALARAQRYIDSGVGFSKKKLIEYLRWSSPATFAYSKADATFAANNVEVNWNWQAFRWASAYLRDRGPLYLRDQGTSMSKDALFRRLTLVYQFTPTQARYAVDKIG